MEQPDTLAPVETPVTPVPAVDGGSLADHEAQFQSEVPRSAQNLADSEPGPTETDDEARDRDDKGRFQTTKHRAKSQQASAEDIPRINELTKKWRTEETSRKALEEKYSALERELQTLKAPKLEAPAAPPAFDAKPPDWKDYEAEADPLAAWTSNTAAYQAKKVLADQQAEQHKTAQAAYDQQQQQARETQMRELVTAYDARVERFLQKQPDFREVVSKMTDEVTPLLRAVLLTDDKGPEYVYALATSPALLAETLLLSDGKPVSESSVALMRRLLNMRVQVASTGSTAAPPSYTPPRPPNPVRTGPNRSGTEVPGDDASLSAHERAYPSRRR